MIELYNCVGSVSYGRFDHFSSAQPTLNYLRETGRLGKVSPAVRMSCFRGNVLQRTYRVVWRGKWRLILEWETPPDTHKPAAQKGKRHKAAFPKEKCGIDGIFTSAQELAGMKAQRFGAFSRNF